MAFTTCWLGYKARLLVMKNKKPCEKISTTARLLVPLLATQTQEKLRNSYVK